MLKLDICQYLAVHAHAYRCCFVSVRSSCVRHTSRAHHAAVHARVGPRAAQAAADRAGRQGQLRAAGQAQEGPAQGSPQGRQDHRGVDLHRGHQHR